LSLKYESLSPTKKKKKTFQNYFLHFAFESAHEKMFENKITGIRENKGEENIWKLCLQLMLRWMSFIVFIRKSSTPKQDIYWLSFKKSMQLRQLHCYFFCSS